MEQDGAKSLAQTGDGQSDENSHASLQKEAALVLGKEGTMENVDFETAIELTGYGRFHWLLLIVCGFVSTSEEMDVVSMSFILPSAQCDLQLDTRAKGCLNSVIFLGMMVGAYVWGSAADSLGRRRVLIVVSLATGICIVASSFSHSFALFLLFRFLNGAALGGSGPVVWSYFAEFQPKRRRGAMLSCMAAFWTLGNLSVAGLAWLVIPYGQDDPADSLSSWRLFLLVCAVPSFVVAGLLTLLPESPKFLAGRGQNEAALAVCRRVFVANTGRDESEYQVRSLAPINSAANGRWLKDIGRNSKQLFTPPVLRFTLISVAINFTFHIGYYGLLMWFPELFHRFNEFGRVHPGQTATVCGVSAYAAAADTDGGNVACSDTVSDTVFLESLLTVSAAVPGNVFAVLAIDRLGRKFFLVFSTLTSGLCAVGLLLVRSATHNLIVSAVFSGAISCGNAALDCLITEVFPTNLRATGVAVSMMAARLGGIIGNVVIATLLDAYCPAPTIIIAILLIGGGLLSLALPNTTRAPLA